MATATLVKFYKGSYDNYKLLIEKEQGTGKYTDGIFFDTTGHTIWMGGQLYSSALNEEELKALIQDKLKGVFVAITPDINNGNPAAGYNFDFVDIDGVSGYAVSIPEVSESYSGVMSAKDFKKLSDINPEDFVLKEGNKVLSDVNFSFDYETKLKNIEEGAEVNTITKILIDDKEQSIGDNRTVNLKISELIKDEINSTVSSAYIFRGSVEYDTDLPEKGKREGDVYNIINYSEKYGSAGVNVAWTGSEWDSLSGIFDTSIIDDSITKLNSEITNIKDRLDILDEVDSSTRLDALENAIEILNGDDTVEGSVLNTVMTSINNALSWEEI